MDSQAEPHLTQQVFRRLLDAVARPGLRQELPHPVRTHEEGVLLVGRTLLDHEVDYAVCGDDPARETIAEALFVTTRARHVGADTARYVFVLGGDGGETLALVYRGTAAYPDRGATVVYLVDEAGGETDGVTLRGPGIDGARAPAFGGLSRTEWRRLKEANAEYPLGVDAFLLARSGALLAIPRSTRITVR